jgi:dTDP-4-dehydrorhamnose reductase
MIKYLVIGADGLVGSRFVELKRKEKLLTPSISELDITDIGSVRNYFETNEFDACVNFAAYTNVDEAKKQRGDKSGLAWVLNVEGARNVAKTCHDFERFLIHISTDFVFPGTEDNPGPYEENAQTPEAPEKLSWYGWTKLEGERKVMEECPKAAIIRIAYPYHPAKYELKTDFAKKILELYDKGDLYPLFEDQIFSPTYVDELVDVIESLAEKKIAGIYHAASRDQTSFFDFGSYLIEKVRGVKNAAKKGSMKEFLKEPGRTPRPRLGGLKTEKTQKKLGFEFKTWREAVDDFVKKSIFS